MTLLKILKALIRIAVNLEKIKTILEIVFKDKLEAHLYLESLKQKYTRTDKDFEVTAHEEIELDQYNEPITKQE
jgi:hypothetical protein